jgi:hypothetical protein
MLVDSHVANADMQAFGKLLKREPVKFRRCLADEQTRALCLLWESSGSPRIWSAIDGKPSRGMPQKARAYQNHFQWRIHEAATENVAKKDQLLPLRVDRLDSTAAVVACLCGLDAEARVTFCNDALLSTTGYRADEMIGKNLHELLHPSRSDGTAYRL